MSKAYRDIEWELGACKGQDLNDYYDLPYSEHKIKYPAMSKLCADCPILEDCYAWAIRHEKHGFWAGLSGKARAEIRRQNRIPFIDPSMIDYV